jgi:hypothetical protein
MCTPGVPAGCGPANSSTDTRADIGTSSVVPGAVQTKTGPAVSFASASTPAANSVSRPATATATDGAWGRVSMAVTKSAVGDVAGDGIRE